MSEKTNLEIDTTVANQKIDALDSKIENMESNLVKATGTVEKKTRESANQVIGMMRASYAMVSGLAQIVGGDIGQIFSAMFGVAVSAIGTYQAISAAMLASGVGTAQAILMTSSLITALVNIGAMATGQTDLAQRISGLNTTLHGFGSLLDNMDFS